MGEVGVAEDKTRLTRRSVLTIVAGGAGLGCVALASPLHADDDAAELVRDLTGSAPTESSRVHLTMPRTFPNGYTVPLILAVDSPMTLADHVRRVHVLAPANPIVRVATFHFVPLRSEPRISTRIRLAAPQNVLAVAEMSDGSVLTAKAWVEVASDGCH
jgi:sulfur-oxidizing protein SoxY